MAASDPPAAYLPVPREARAATVPTLRVAGQTDARNAATAIVRRVLDFKAVRLEVVGANSVNQAAKGIAIARNNLEASGRSCAAQVGFIHVPARGSGQAERSAVQFTVFRCPPHVCQTEGAHVLHVAQRQDPKSVAQTIVKQMQDKHQLQVQVVGAPSVNVAVKAIAIASKSLTGAAGMQVGCFPEFVRVPAPTPADRDHSALRWTLLPTDEAHAPLCLPPTLADRVQCNEEVPDAGRLACLRPLDLGPPPFQPENDAHASHSLQELRVATASDPKVIAGAIGAHLRSHDPVRVTVMGPASVNQATKALAALRGTMLDDSVDFAAYANFTHLPMGDNGPERSAIQLTVCPCRPEEQEDRSDVQEYKVAGSTNPKSTAGAISNCVRGGATCRLEALGRKAVNQAIKAIAIGRGNLRHDQLDISFLPRFRSVEMKDGRRSAMELTIVPIRGQ